MHLWKSTKTLKVEHVTIETSNLIEKELEGTILKHEERELELEEQMLKKDEIILNLKYVRT
jgi:hypothetical protein